jgi:transcriptional regulator with XRE-family HTH domain
MDIRSDKIKALRNQKGWTQQHLADACGLSLRTIQRVERYGAGSKETALSLCSVFEIELADILVLEETEQQAEGSTSSPANVFLLIVPALVFGVIAGSSITFWLMN